MKCGRTLAAMALVVVMAAQGWAGGNVTVVVKSGSVKVTGQNNTEQSVLISRNLMG